MLEAYRKHVEERAAQGVPPKPLDEVQTAELVELLKNPPAGEEEFIQDLFVNRIPPGVDQAAYVKAAFLTAIVDMPRSAATSDVGRSSTAVAQKARHVFSAKSLRKRSSARR